MMSEGITRSIIGQLLKVLKKGVEFFFAQDFP
jgi:hypothetical protein